MPTPVRLSCDAYCVEALVCVGNLCWLLKFDVSRSGIGWVPGVGFDVLVLGVDEPGMDGLVVDRLDGGELGARTDPSARLVVVVVEVVSSIVPSICFVVGAAPMTL